ncbi:hypothetical protein CRYUN_Cryun24cG0019800 [Craigia yunnanensis]
MGLHLVIPCHVHRPVPYRLFPPPPLFIPPRQTWQTGLAGSNPGPPQPHHIHRLRRYLRRNPPLCRR